MLSLSLKNIIPKLQLEPYRGDPDAPTRKKCARKEGLLIKWSLLYEGLDQYTQKTSGDPTLAGVQ